MGCAGGTGTVVRVTLTFVVVTTRVVVDVVASPGWKGDERDADEAVVVPSTAGVAWSSCEPQPARKRPAIKTGPVSRETRQRDDKC